LYAFDPQQKNDLRTTQAVKVEVAGVERKSFSFFVAVQSGCTKEPICTATPIKTTTTETAHKGQRH